MGEPQGGARDRRAATASGLTVPGWRVYQDRCARCHGVEATGTANAPDLLRRVPALGSRAFVSLVLYRYDVTLQGQPAAGRTARDEQVEVIMERRGQPLVMPAWQDEASVNAHILDMYAYRPSRAEGRLSSGKPEP